MPPGATRELVPGICADCEAEARVSQYTGLCEGCHRKRYMVDYRRSRRSPTDDLAHYEDTGCEEVSPMCTLCWLPKCKVELTWAQKRELIPVAA